MLHPGEGARVLEPIVGMNSVILLDGDAHMEQRKLMLPAFHGERMERLTDLVSRVTADEIGTWEGNGIGLHPRVQGLTLEIILRAVFGLDPGPRLDALRENLTRLLAYGKSPLTLIPGPEGRGAARPADADVQPARAAQGTFLDVRQRIDELIFEQIHERRAEADADRDDVLAMLLDARHEDGSADVGPGASRRALDAAGRRPRDHGLHLAWAFERLSREPEVLGRLTAEVREGEDELPPRHDPGDAAPPPGAAQHRAAPGEEADHGRRLGLPGRLSAWWRTPT